MRKLVILGGGYGGLAVAQELLKRDIPIDTSIVLVDKMPYQGLKTEYYSLASGSVADVDIRVQFPDDPRLLIQYGEVSEIGGAAKQVHFAEDPPLTYDWLVVALGCTDHYHGIPGAEVNSNSIQTLSATRRTYQRINDIAPYGIVSIVGGGLSGVELAAELRETRKDLNLRILDRGPSILSSFPPKLQNFVRTWFNEREVELRPHISVVRVEDGLVYNNNEVIHSDAVIWTAGIQPNPVVQKLDVPKDPQGRVLLNEYYQIPQLPDIFVVGDCASLPFSPSAQAAESQGKQVAEVIDALWRGEKPQLGKIKLRGVLGSLGKKSGFGVMGKRTVMLGVVPRALKSGVLWMSKRNLG